MFGLYSKPILTIRFKSDFIMFDCWPIQPDSANTARFWLNHPGPARIVANQAESARIREKKKKKKHSDAAPTQGQPRRTPVRHSPSRVRASY